MKKSLSRPTPERGEGRILKNTQPNEATVWTIKSSALFTRLGSKKKRRFVQTVACRGGVFYTHGNPGNKNQPHIKKRQELSVDKPIYKRHTEFCLRRKRGEGGQVCLKSHRGFLTSTQKKRSNPLVGPLAQQPPAGGKRGRSVPVP